MPVYTYRGTNRAGAPVTGERQSQNKAQLAAALRRENINVSKLSEKGREFSIPTFGTRASIPRNSPYLRASFR